GTLFKFEMENNTRSRYENKMIIDGERYPIGTTLSSINIDLNGQYELVIITKDKENGLYSYNGYYIDNNRNYAASDNYYTRDISEYNRNILIARTRDEQLPRFTNELLQDFRTGDISVYDGEEVIDITKKIKDDISNFEKEVTNIISSNSDLRSRHDYLAEHIYSIERNNKILNESLADAIDSIKNIDKSVENAIKVNEGISELYDDLNIKRKAHDRTESQSERLAQIDKEIPGIIEEVKDNIKLYNDNISLVAKSFYNFKSIELNTKNKISVSEFNKFKNKYQKFFNNFVNIVDRF